MADKNEAPALRILSWFAILIAALLVNASAQVPTGSIEGTVADVNGAAIPGTTITITQKARGRQLTATSNSKGAYTISALSPGEYDLVFAAPGFKKAVLSLKVDVGEAAGGDTVLEVGLQEETVTVTASDEGQVDLNRNTVSAIVTARHIEGLPLNGRNFLDLASLEPGVQTIEGGAFDPTKNGFTGVSVAGGEGRTTRIQVDGIDITDETVGTTVQNYSLDSLQEFQISQFSLDPSTSLSNTGAVNIATRSGENDVHGSGYFFFRDHSLAARVGNQVAPFDREQGGFRIGGPIKRDRIFWFANVEQNNQDSSTFLSPPAPFNKFEGFAASPYDERFGTGRVDWAAGDRIHIFSRFTHNDSKGVTGFGGTDLAPFVSGNNSNSTVVGIDVTLKRFTHSARYGHINFANYINPVTPQGVPALPLFVQFGDIGVQFGPDILAPQHTLQTNDEYRYDGSYVHGDHTFRYGADYNRITVNLFAAFLGQAPIVDTLTTLNFGGDPSNPLDYLPIDIVFGNGLGFFSEKTSHGYQFGGISNNRFAWYASDSWRARRDLTFNLGVRWEIDPGQVNHDLARPAILDSVAQGESRNVRLDRNNFAPTLGFAWDVNGRGNTVVRAGSGIYYSTNIFTNVIFERASLLPNTIAPAFPFVFDAPGFNILRGPNGENIFDFTSVSSGPLSTNTIRILAAQARLQALSQEATASFPDGPISLLPPGGLPGTQNTAGPLFASEFSQPYSIQTNIGIQHRIGRNWIAQADYVRNRSVHTPMVRDYNRVGAADTLNRARAVDAIAATLAQFQASSVNDAISLGATMGDFVNNGLGAGGAFPGNNPDFGNLAMISTQGLSTYNALQVRLTGRTGRVGPLVSSASWGISYALSRFEATQSDQAFAQAGIDNDCPTCLYGPAGVDRTHQLTFYTMANLPLGLRFNTINRIATAIPVTLRLNPAGAGSGEIFFTDINGDGRGTDLLPGTNLGAFGRDVKGVNDLNAAITSFNDNFSGNLTPAAQSLVNAGLFTQSQLRELAATIPAMAPAPLDQVSIDSFLISDFRISRVFRMRETWAIEPSIDVFNVFNVANYDPPGGALSTVGPLSGILSGSAGTVNGTPQGKRTNKSGLGAGSFSPGIPRSFQFGLRITF
jgi:hypothetical protein